MHCAHSHAAEHYEQLLHADLQRELSVFTFSQDSHFSEVTFDLLPSGCDETLIRWRVSKTSSSFSAWLHLPF